MTRIQDALMHSRAWAFVLALVAADALAQIGDAHGWHYPARLVMVVLFATWAHSVWHRAERRDEERPG